ncbi:FkbM family methyltransferase [Nodularia harveyana UHCC-0300]|uniref:FkbM family methyltransferase n=1 Tax=Nodularia harveyana UHCC-0300 TaxID=2974287 RepID=A0ABU5U9K4_9CYAN|nr:FkbM family methyltransferase [Nodularia harveyana]MEA5580023.1 FkbM family methyltransferase [Nodularia harveyana UHCC-0300]
MKMLQDIESQGKLISELLILKKKILQEYLGEAKIKKEIEEEIYYDFFLYDRLLRKYSCKRNGAIYLGGHKGEMLLALVLLGFKKILVIEPQPELFQQLQEKITVINQLLSYYDTLVEGQPTTSIEIFHTAVGAVDGEAELYMTSESQLTSLFKPKEAIINEETIYSQVKVNETIKVPLQTIDTIIEKSSGEISDFDFLYMNIQGGELKALEGAKQTLPQLQAIYLEQNLIPRYEACPEAVEIDKCLIDRNFTKVWRYTLESHGVSYDWYINRIGV